MLRAFVHRAFLLLLFASGLALAGEDEWRAHMQAGEAAQRRGDSAAASASFTAALRDAEGFGVQDRRLAETLTRVAASHQAQGRLAEAETDFLRALAIREATDGPGHFEVSRILNSIAVNYARQGRFAEAEPLWTRAIAIAEKTYGPDHLSVATALNSLGQLKYQQGRYAEAEAYHLRALAIREKARGPDHPLLMPDLNGLAAIYFKTGDYAKAESFSTRLLALREKSFGPDHTDVAKSLYELGDLRRAQGRPGDAAPLYLRALQILKSKSTLPAQRDAATVQAKLDELRRMQGRSGDTAQPGQTVEKAPAQEPPSHEQDTTATSAAAARIWERDRYELTIKTANQAKERGETAEAERLCFLAISYVGERTVRVLEEYAALLATLNRAGAREAKERVERLSDQRLRREPGSIHLGFEPAGELTAYARLLRELTRTAEAGAVIALAEAERRVSFINFIRNAVLARGGDPRGICSVDNNPTR